MNRHINIFLLTSKISLSSSISSTHFRWEAAVEVGRFRLCPWLTPGRRQWSTQSSIHDGRVGWRVVWSSCGTGWHSRWGARGRLRRQWGGGGGGRVGGLAAWGWVAVGHCCWGGCRGHHSRAIFATSLCKIIPLLETSPVKSVQL